MPGRNEKSIHGRASSRQRRWELRDQKRGKNRLSLPHTPSTTFSIATNSIHVYSYIFFLSVRTWQLLGHREAATSSSVGPAALQGSELEGACDGGWVFDKDGKTRT
jgi:hypothetical protein